MDSLGKIVTVFGLAASVAGAGLAGRAVYDGATARAADYEKKEACWQARDKGAECRAAEERAWGNTRLGLLGMSVLGAGGLLIGAGREKKPEPLPRLFSRRGAF